VAKHFFNECSEKCQRTARNSLSSRKGNSFELLDELAGDESITVQTTSTRGRPLKRTQPFEPNSPPHAKRANSTKATTSQVGPALEGTDQWAQVKAFLTHVETALVASVGNSIRPYCLAVWVCKIHENLCRLWKLQGISLWQQSRCWSNYRVDRAIIVHAAPASLCLYCQEYGRILFPTLIGCILRWQWTTWAVHIIANMVSMFITGFEAFRLGINQLPAKATLKVGLPAFTKPLKLLFDFDIMLLQPMFFRQVRFKGISAITDLRTSLASYLYVVSPHLSMGMLGVLVALPIGHVDKGCTTMLKYTATRAPARISWSSMELIAWLTFGCPELRSSCNGVWEHVIYLFELERHGHLRHLSIVMRCTWGLSVKMQRPLFQKTIKLTTTVT